MNPVEFVRNEADESDALEYKDRATDNSDIAKELVALGNSGGGILILGVRENDGEIEQIQTVENPSEREEAVNQVITQLVEPRISFSMEVHEIENEQIVSFEVEEAQTIHSFEDDQVPLFPTRQGSTTTYLHGYEMENRYRNRQDNQSIELPKDENTVKGENTGRLALPEKPDLYFTPIPEGHIGRVCTFCDVYWPRNPYSADIKLMGVTIDEVVEILGNLLEIIDFNFHSTSFTIHQTDGAWFGEGFKNFISSLKSQDYRYSIIPSEIDFKSYKTEEGLFFGTSDYPYRDSVVAVHGERYHQSEEFRSFSITFIFNGIPIDSHRLEEWASESELILGNAKSINIEKKGFPEPTQIPVNTVDLIEEEKSVSEDTFVKGAVCKNPFYGKSDMIKSKIGLKNAGAIGEYELIPARIRDHHRKAAPKSYDSVRFLITDMSDILERVPLSVHNLEYEINW